MVESMRQISNPARSSGVATAKIPKGAVASELANDGKKKTILRDLDNEFSSLKENDRYSAKPSCHRNVSNLSGVCCARGEKSGVCQRSASFPATIQRVRALLPHRSSGPGLGVADDVARRGRRSREHLR